MSTTLKIIRFPTLVKYETALQLQQKLVIQKLLNRSNEPDYLIILEHEPSITLGRQCHNDPPILTCSIPIIKSPRGGKVTYHGPGQFTCYPIIDLKRQPKLSLECYVRNLAHVMKDSLKKYTKNEISNESANRIENSLFYNDAADRVGLWLPGNKKIGFIGIHAQKWIVSHGFSLNIQRQCLKGFREIDPCGLQSQNVLITCLEDELLLESLNPKFLTESLVQSIIDAFKAKFY